MPGCILAKTILIRKLAWNQLSLYYHHSSTLNISPNAIRITRNSGGDMNAIAVGIQHQEKNLPQVSQVGFKSPIFGLEICALITEQLETVRF